MDYSRKLAEHAKAGLAREHLSLEGPQSVHVTADGRELVSFCSNDYLGLANHVDVCHAFKQAIDHYGVGSGASHLISGHRDTHHELEKELAEFIGYPRALLFSTGYMANLAVLTTLTDRHDVIYQDKLNHASLIDAGQLSQAKVRRYKHNDTDDLQRIINIDKPEGGMVVTDGVFSMGGDIAKLDELARIAHENNLLLVVDDAHGLGHVAHGKGCKGHFDLSSEELPVLVGTLGKAFGTFGAFVAASNETIEMLVQFARSYVYTTALPPAVAAATRVSLRLIQHDQMRYHRLYSNIEQFCRLARESGLSVKESSTAIQFIELDDNEQLLELKQLLKGAGYLVSIIRPPTVAQSGIRITLCSEHSHEDIERLVKTLSGVLKRAA